MKVYEVTVAFAQHHIGILGPDTMYQVSVYRTIDPLGKMKHSIRYDERGGRGKDLL